MNSRRGLRWLLVLALGFSGVCGAAGRGEPTNKPTESKAMDYFFEPVGAARSKGAVHLRFPEALYVGAQVGHQPSQPLHGQKAALLMVHPHLSGLNEPQSAECLNAMEACLQLLTVDLRLKPSDFDDAAWARTFVEEKLKSERFIRAQKPSSAHPGLELVGIQKLPEDGGVVLDRTIYLSRDAQGQPERVFSCGATKNLPYTLCITYFSLERAPTIQVVLTFAQQLLPQREQLVRDVRTKIDSMVVASAATAPSPSTKKE